METAGLGRQASHWPSQVRQSQGEAARRSREGMDEELREKLRSIVSSFLRSPPLVVSVLVQQDSNSSLVRTLTSFSTRNSPLSCRAEVSREVIEGVVSTEALRNSPVELCTHGHPL